MITFNTFNLRKDDDGKTFLDLEVTLTWHPQRIVMRHSFPATSDYFPPFINPNHESNSLMNNQQSEEQAS
jgi:hypothetical protein